MELLKGRPCKVMVTKLFGKWADRVSRQLVLKASNHYTHPFARQGTHLSSLLQLVHTSLQHLMFTMLGLASGRMGQRRLQAWETVHDVRVKCVRWRLVVLHNCATKHGRKCIRIKERTKNKQEKRKKRSCFKSHEVVKIQELSLPLTNNLVKVVNLLRFS